MQVDFIKAWKETYTHVVCQYVVDGDTCEFSWFFDVSAFKLHPDFLLIRNDQSIDLSIDDMSNKYPELYIALTRDFSPTDCLFLPVGCTFVKRNRSVFNLRDDIIQTVNNIFELA